MAQTHIPIDSAELLQVDLSDKSLKATIDDSIKKFMKASMHLAKISKINAAS